MSHPLEIRQKIIDLRATGLGYKLIAASLGLNRSVVQYWCNHDKEREKGRVRKSKSFNQNPLLRKISHYKNRKLFVAKTRDFQRRIGNALSKTVGNGFTADDFLAKVGAVPRCYLTGRVIDLNQPDTYSFDHVVPVTKGGDNSLENLGLTIRAINTMKSTHTVDELISLMKEVLEYQGYTITKKFG